MYRLLWDTEIHGGLATLTHKNGAEVVVRFPEFFEEPPEARNNFLSEAAALGVSQAA
jgi:hypothetical protein